MDQIYKFQPHRTTDLQGFNSFGAAAALWGVSDCSANLAAINLPATINTDCDFLGLDGSYVPCDANPGDGYFGQLMATASSSTSITGQAANGDASMLANEYRNFQIRIVQGAPVAGGEHRLTGFFGDSIRYRSNQSIVDEMLKIKARTRGTRGRAAELYGAAGISTRKRAP